MPNRRILIIEVNWLGDVLFSTPAIRALRKKYPDSYLAVLVHKRCREILVGNPYVNEIIALDEEDKHKGIRGKLKLIKQLKNKRFDTVYLLHRSFTRTLICLLSGIKKRIGYFTPKRRFLLTESIQPPQRSIHRAAYYYYLVTKELPLDTTELYCDFFMKEKDSFYVKSLLEKERFCAEKKLVVIHPAGNWMPKRWPKESFARLADELIDKFDVNVVFSGGKLEKENVGDILDLMKKKAINLSGKTSLKQLGALFKMSDLVISADSGPLHIAVALKKPTVALFGPTSRNITGPLTKDNIAVLQKEVGCQIPCYKVNCSDNRCMQEISVKDVIDCLKEKRWLEKTR